jgi:hypothetical protein
MKRSPTLASRSFVAAKRRELASRIYNEYPLLVSYFPTVLLGYARVSTLEQTPDHQIDALARAGVTAKDIYIDHASGARPADRSSTSLLRMLRNDGTLKITRLHRLGRQPCIS